MLYELINPSDPYVFDAKDYETAALVVFSLGTIYGAEAEEGEDGEFDVPVSFMIDPEEWFINTCGRSTEEALKEKKKDVADALLSMTYGNTKDYRFYQNTLNAIEDTEKKDQFKTEWADRRSSLNCIGDRCHLMGKKIYEINGWQIE